MINSKIDSKIDMNEFGEIVEVEVRPKVVKAEPVVDLDCIKEEVSLSDMIRMKTNGGKDMVEWFYGLMKANHVKGRKVEQAKVVLYDGLQVKLAHKLQAAEWLADRGWGKSIQPEITKKYESEKGIEVLRREVMKMLSKKGMKVGE